MRGVHRKDVQQIVEVISEWLVSAAEYLEIQDKTN